MEELLVKFKEWLINVKKYKGRAPSSRISNIKTLNNNYDLLREFSNNECLGILDELTFSRDDVEPKTSIIINGDYYTGLATYKQALKLFVEFLKDIKYVHHVVKIAPASFFEGNFASFKDYVGPKCRNEVNYFCKKERDKHKRICEYCNKEATLESAHKKDRPIIMKEILEKYYKIGNDYYRVNLPEFFDKFKKEHFPIRDKIFFLCPKCHGDLDKRKTITIKMIEDKRKTAID